jgi:hypothetical protein
MFIALPASFPEAKFQEFGVLSAKFFPKVLSDEYLADPLQNPKKITVEETAKAFAIAFPHASLTAHLAALLQDADYKQIGVLRNILANRLTGRRSITVDGVIRSDGSSAYIREDKWYVLGAQD